MNHYANVYYYSYTLDLSYYVASFQTDCNNLYATHLFNSSLNVTQMHCTDGGITGVIPIWCSCFFCSFFVFWVKLLANCIRFWLKILTTLTLVQESHLSLQKG